jgi:hypothetical protein
MPSPAVDFTKEADALAVLAAALKRLPDRISQLRVMVHVCTELEQYDQAAEFADALSRELNIRALEVRRGR